MKFTMTLWYIYLLSSNSKDPTGPYLTTYIDGNFIFTERVDIYKTVEPQAVYGSDANVNIGFTSSTTTKNQSAHFLTNWRLRTFGDGI